MGVWRVSWLMIALVLTGVGGAWAQKESRVALVIGNGAYQHAEPLRNPVNDARAMARVLKDAGFEVIAHENLTRRAFVDALHEFSGKVPPGGVGLFYYAGHGIQVRGVNHLVPVDAALANERDIKYETVDLNDVLGGLDEARARLSLVILDACRDNPFARRFRSTSRGLAQADAPRGTVIAYATAPGDTAADGDGENGLYTTELLKAIVVPGLKLEEVFKRTIDGVARASANKQTPWVSSSFRGDFIFNAAVAVPAPPPPPPVAAPSSPDIVETAAWNAIGNSNDPALYELFLKRFPNGLYADFARAKLDTLKRAAALEEQQRSTAAEEAKRRADTEEARRTAATEEARRRAAAEDEKKSVENAEAALKLADIDRRRIQAALTAKGFDTLGTDGAFGPRTRLMITNWQRSRNEPPTGFLTATQAALLSQEGQSALTRIEEERKKADAEARRATDKAAKAGSPFSPEFVEAARRALDAPPPPPQAAAEQPQPQTPPPVDAGARDGSWRVTTTCPETSFRGFSVSGQTVSANLALWNHDGRTLSQLPPINVAATSPLRPDGGFTFKYSDTVTITGTISAATITGTVQLHAISKTCQVNGAKR